jgi:diguanylate cyclase (GGDEF)-like protein
MWAYLYLVKDPTPKGVWWDLLPHILLASGGLLALRFGSSRVLMVICLAWFGIQAMAGAVDNDAEPLLAFAGIALLVISIMPERGVVSWSALLMALPVFAVASYGHWPSDWQGQVHGFLALATLVTMPKWIGVSTGIVFVYGVSSLILLYRLSKNSTPIDSGLFGTTVAWILLATHTGPHGSFYAVCVATIGFLTALETTHALAFRDQLTGLPSRRALDRSLGRLGGTYTLAMVDVDSFKKFNDRYGHDAGDEALRMIAGHLRQVRGGGKAYRYGGEEFTVVFPNRNADQAAEHLETLRKTVAESPFTLRSADRPKRKPKKTTRSRATGQIKVTVSIGVAERSNKTPCTTTVLKAADKCLYRAKRTGRNKLVAAA